MHIEEPGCAVKKAVEEGKISADRLYTVYLKYSWHHSIQRNGRSKNEIS